MKLLLEKNCNETLEARFEIFSDQVLLISSRILKEISRIMTVVVTIADDSAEALMANSACKPVPTQGLKNETG